jgi:AAA+ superfamily predicted ATPase
VKVAECVVTNEMMPLSRYAGLWNSIVIEDEVKDRLVNQALLGLELRAKLGFEVTALHGLVLLHGPPGTGKTTLARGLAYQLSPLVQGRAVRLIEVNPHGLMSAEHGQSQQKVMELLCDHIPLLADDGRPTVVVLDEVESMTVARSAASLSANPADVHRATDAVLAALDRNTAEYPHLFTVATSNFTASLDEAFQSRADCAIEVPLPHAAAIVAILARTLHGFAEAYPPLGQLADSAGLTRVAAKLVGADGRRVRKLVTEAMARRRDTVLNPGALTLADLLAAAEVLAIDLPRGGERGAAA